MWRSTFRTTVVGLVVLISMLATPAFSWAGGPGVWTKLATVDNSFDTVGMLRTANGTLHLVWLKKKASNNTHAYGTSTISQAGTLLATGTALSNWGSLEPDPQLVRDGSGLRLVFEGNTGSSGCYASASVFTATSLNGSTWTLANGSMDNHVAGTGNLAATAEANGITPVATFAAGHLFHVGVDPSCPASSPDGMITPTAGSVQSNPAIATDPQSSAVWVAWYQNFKKEGYWVNRILPSQGSPTEAPGSSATPSQNNQPHQPVALAARRGGGVYMAYCTATSTQPCAHIDLWKVGSSTAKIVPGSNQVIGARVALAAGPQGRLSVVWYDEGKNLIHAVRTNTNATSFGIVRTIKSPPHTSGVSSIQAEGTSGRLDVILDDTLSTAGAPIELLHTQILSGVSMTAKPTTFSHNNATKVTFTVTDAGQAVAGATVSCLGKTGKTSTTGQVALAFPKGTAVGKHVCTASKAGYNAGKTTITVT